MRSRHWPLANRSFPPHPSHLYMSSYRNIGSESAGMVSPVRNDTIFPMRCKAKRGGAAVTSGDPVTDQNPSDNPDDSRHRCQIFGGPAHGWMPVNTWHLRQPDDSSQSAISFRGTAHRERNPARWFVLTKNRRDVSAERPCHRPVRWPSPQTTLSAGGRISRLRPPEMQPGVENPARILLEV